MSIFKFLYVGMEEPSSFGLFHIVMVLSLSIFNIYLVKRKKNNKELTVLVLSLILLVLEILKQIYYSYNIDTNIWNYRWFVFPFQYCSIPMYLGVLAYFIKSEKIKNYMYIYIATYGLLGGLATLIYPEGVFTDTIFMNLQTFIHHGFQVVMGVYILSFRDIKFNRKNIINCFILFMIIFIMAMSMNIASYYLSIDGGLEMFFVSPFHKCILPILSEIYEFNYFIFLIVYILIALLGSTIVLKIGSKRREKC